MLSPNATNTLFTFDSTRLMRHITPQDDKAMVDFIINEYGSALRYALGYYNSDIRSNMRMHYDDICLSATMAMDDQYRDGEAYKLMSFFKGTVDDDGTVHSKRARYGELVDLCIDTFNGEIAAYLRSIQLDQARKIYTVKVVGYENRTLKVLVSTDGPIIP